MTADEVLATVVLSVAIIWAWSQVVGFFLTVVVAAARAFWRTRIEFRGPTVEDVLADPRGVGPLLDPAGNIGTTKTNVSVWKDGKAVPISEIEMPPPPKPSDLASMKDRAEKEIRDATTLPEHLVRDPLDELIREAGRLPHYNCRCGTSFSMGHGLPNRSGTHEFGRPRRRMQLVERLALDVGEDDPVFCSWPAGRQTITLPTRGGDPMILVRTDECVLDDATSRLAVVYRQQPENGKAEQ